MITRLPAQLEIQNMLTLPTEVLEKYPQLASIQIGMYEIVIALITQAIPFFPQEQKDQLFLQLISPEVITIIPWITASVLLVILVLFLFNWLRIFVVILRKPKTIEETEVLLELRPHYGYKQSILATAELFKILHSAAQPHTWKTRLLNNSSSYSLEIISTKKEGIRYAVRVPKEDGSIIQKALRSHFPDLKITKIAEYLPESLDELTSKGYVFKEYGQAQPFPFPLRTQNKLEIQDPIAYMAGMMGKLENNELMLLQYVIHPVDKKTTKTQQELLHKIINSEPVFESIKSLSRQTPLNITLTWLIRIVLFIFLTWVLIAFYLIKYILQKRKLIYYTKRQEELLGQIKEKLEQPLYEVTIRSLVKTSSTKKQKERTRGLTASFSAFKNTHQAIIPVKRLDLFSLPIFKKALLYSLKTRNHAVVMVSALSTSELSDLYHFPNTKSTRVEDLAKIHSKELPAPLSVKNNDNLDVMFGKNTYDNSNVNIGLTDDDRSRHVYILGQTGSGKTTIIYHMAKDDIQKGRGVAVVDPHGDLAEDLLTTIPKERIDDCIYLNPFDLGYPIGINLLELPQNLEGDALEQEKEMVGEGVISVFRRVFSNDEKTNAHRIEYILRNAIYTAFTIPNATIFTIYELLNNPKYRKKIVKNLADANLKNFWKNEFGKAGNFQVVKMVSGVTAKIGRFLFSPSAKRILEQPKSTINFDDILESGKIIICNLSEGKLGEDTAQLLGTTIITKIQQAAMRRERKGGKERKPFYVFVDEFQNFATSSFTKLLSGGRKFGLRMTIAEQSTAQQDDHNVVNVILANTGTVICFRTASPIDAKLMADQFKPYVDRGDINNLPRYRFYIRLAAVEPEEPFSGTTIPMTSENKRLVKQILESSRRNYAIKYAQPKLEVKKPIQRKVRKRTISQATSILP